jgi:hypothetical protein
MVHVALHYCYIEFKGPNFILLIFILCLVGTLCQCEAGSMASIRGDLTATKADGWLNLSVLHLWIAQVVHH